MTDAAQASRRHELVSKAHIPVRTCVVCGAKKPKESLLRTALDTGERKIVLDQRQCMNGRGAYVCSRCLPRLRFNKRVAKAFRGKARGLAESAFVLLRTERDVEENLS